MNKMDEVLHKALALSARAEHGFYDLARHLAVLQEHDPTRWRQFLTQSKIGRRKAYYLVEIAHQFADLNVSKRRLEQIGWTRLQIIGGHISRANAESLLQLAEENTAAQLQARMQGAEAGQKLHCVMMYFTPKQYRQVEYVLLQHGATRSGRGLHGKEQAMVSLIRRARQAMPMSERHRRGRARSK